VHARAEIVSFNGLQVRLDAWLALNVGELPPSARWPDVAGQVSVTRKISIVSCGNTVYLLQDPKSSEKPVALDRPGCAGACWQVKGGSLDVQNGD
jgi:hypothetical protein